MAWAQKRVATAARQQAKASRDQARESKKRRWCQPTLPPQQRPTSAPFPSPPTTGCSPATLPEKRTSQRKHVREHPTWPVISAHWRPPRRSAIAKCVTAGEADSNHQGQRTSNAEAASTWGVHPTVAQRLSPIRLQPQGLSQVTLAQGQVPCRARHLGPYKGRWRSRKPRPPPLGAPFARLPTHPGLDLEDHPRNRPLLALPQGQPAPRASCPWSAA